MTSRKVALSLGSNLGDKAGHVQAALNMLNAVDGVRVTDTSSFYRTAPWGDQDQDWFVNACALTDTVLPPEALLTELKRIEERLGRTETRRWGPRVIDMDILVFGDVEMVSERLTIPHPDLVNRVFVLIPLMEIWPDLLIHGKMLDVHLSRLPREEGDISLHHGATP